MLLLCNFPGKKESEDVFLESLCLSSWTGQLKYDFNICFSIQKIPDGSERDRHVLALCRKKKIL